MTAVRIATALGAIALALIVGALGFQYLGGLPPCEMCHWQRWPLIAAAAIGIIGGVTVKGDARWLAALIVLLVAASGAIGAYQAGVEWHWWPGPAECTGTRFVFHGLDNLNSMGAVRCDVAAWRLFAISLAGYNAAISLGSALLALVFLTRTSK